LAFIIASCVVIITSGNETLNLLHHTFDRSSEQQITNDWSGWH